MKDLCEAYCSTIFLWCCPNLKADPPAAGLFDEMLLRRVGLAASPDHWHNRSYDMWSLGVLLLELVLGTRDSDR